MSELSGCAGEMRRADKPGQGEVVAVRIVASQRQMKAALAGGRAVASAHIAARFRQDRHHVVEKSWRCRSARNGHWDTAHSGDAVHLYGRCYDRFACASRLDNSRKRYRGNIRIAARERRSGRDVAHAAISKLPVHE